MFSFGNIVFGNDMWHGPNSLTQAEDSNGCESSILRVIAHEVGHALEISTRKSKDQNGKDTPHDIGPFPKGTKALMFPSIPNGRWMRHEDWRSGNSSAYFK